MQEYTLKRMKIFSRIEKKVKQNEERYDILKDRNTKTDTGRHYGARAYKNSADRKQSNRRR